MSTRRAGNASVLTVGGVLDSSTYLELKDRVVKEALDEPLAVLIDVTALDVPAPSAWSVFTSARWQVSTWPDIPIMLICRRPELAAQITRSGITRYVPVHLHATLALRAVTSGAQARRRARFELSRSPSSLRRARELAAETLAGWSQDSLIATAKVIADVFVENVLRHTESAPVLVLESVGATVTVAVQDASRQAAVLHERAAGGTDTVSGLVVVAALSRAWGSTATMDGKTVWAVLSPDRGL